jgi:hypothetical protein
MSTNEDITWREFELLVARIEKQLSPLGAIIKSPDSIIDKVSGSPREVDASIRYVVGSTPILITIECRNREKLQDDTWIEQLAKKKEKNWRISNHCRFKKRILSTIKKNSSTLQY